jgi:nucleoside-diphosphate-sugar epimerase
MPGTVLILGSNGKIGTHAARAFGAAGWDVLRYTRGTDMAEAAQGCDVIVNGLNPPNYHNWAKLIPEITAQVIEAAKACGGTVILPGNVYNFGTAPCPWDETTPQKPTTRKGRIRVEMEDTYRASGVQTIVLRAGDFIDPDRNGCVMTLIYLRDIAKGRVTMTGDPNVERTYCYLPDWARAASALADMRRDLAAFEDVPFPGQVFSTAALKAHLEARLERELSLVRFPWMVMTLASPFWELARELREMRYLFDLPHRMSGEKLARLLPDFEMTAVETAMEAALPPDIHPNQPMV